MQFFPTRARLIDPKVRQDRAAGWRETLSFGNHPLGLATLRFRELRGYYNETQVDHEKRADLVK